jgi:ribosomal protein S1
MRATYSRTPALKSKPKDQRSIIADVLLRANEGMDRGQIISEAKKADYEKRFKNGKQQVTIEESVAYHLDRMVKLGVVKRELVKD